MISSRRSAVKFSGSLSKGLLIILHGLWRIHNACLHPKSEGCISLNAYFQIQTNIKVQLKLVTKVLPKEYHYILIETREILRNKPGA